MVSLASWSLKVFAKVTIFVIILTMSVAGLEAIGGELIVGNSSRSNNATSLNGPMNTTHADGSENRERSGSGLPSTTESKSLSEIPSNSTTELKSKSEITSNSTTGLTLASKRPSTMGTTLGQPSQESSLTTNSTSNVQQTSAATVVASSPVFTSTPLREKNCSCPTTLPCAEDHRAASVGITTNTSTISSAISESNEKDLTTTTRDATQMQKPLVNETSINVTIDATIKMSSSTPRSVSPVRPVAVTTDESVHHEYNKPILTSKMGRSTGQNSFGSKFVKIILAILIILFILFASAKLWFFCVGTENPFKCFLFDWIINGVIAGISATWKVLSTCCKRGHGSGLQHEEWRLSQLELIPNEEHPNYERL